MANLNIHSQTVSAQTVSSGVLVIRSIPLVLIFMRLAVTIVLLIDSIDGSTSNWFVPMLCTGTFLDCIDGALARRIGVATKRLREADSTLDFFMVVVFVICCWLTRRAAIAQAFPWLVASIVLNLISFLPAIIKYGSLPPYHTYSARITGVFIFLGAVELFSISRVSIFMNLALFVGFISQLDRVAITLILPLPPNCDVKSFWHALQLRGGKL